MLDKIYKLQDTLDIYVSDLDSGKILITFHRMTTRERIEIISTKEVASFLAHFNGKDNVNQILNTLGEFSKESAIKLIKFLLEEHFIYEVTKKEDNPRFSRQIAYFNDMVLNHSGEKSQHLLKTKKIVILGCGAVTANIAETLVRAGVEQFILVDFKRVKKSNIIRDTYIRYSDIGKYKVDVLANYLKRINRNINITLFYDILKPETDLNTWISDDVSLVVNGCDEPYIGHTSLKIGRFLQSKNIPMYVMGGFDAHLMSSGELIFPPKTPCIDCCQKTFSNSLRDWKPTYITSEKPLALVKGKSKEMAQEQLFNIGGAGGLSIMSSFSANLSCIRLIQFLIGDKMLDYKTIRYEFLLNSGEITSFEMFKQPTCEVCGG